MARLINAIACLSFASIAISSPLSSLQDAGSPCAQVSASVATQPGPVRTVPADLAYKCITSVPFNQQAALTLVDDVVPYFRWQSTTAWLKDPPQEYKEKIQDGVDVWGGLQKIRNKVTSNAYANEFEFGFELYRLLQTTHDGHFIYVPDVVGTVFNYARPVPLVSVSADGFELPKPYVYADVLAESLGNVHYEPSPVSKINGQDAKQFLENWSQYGSLQDRDALYNNVFYELATVSLGPVGSGIGTFAGSGRGRWIYPGPTTELTFENGTTRVYENFANVLIPFDGITDGESLYNLWFTGNKPVQAQNAAPAPSAQPAAIPAPGYPPPIYRESHNLIGGYYLEDNYSDVAVLSVPSFVGIANAAVPFQQTALDFITAAKAAGKTKLVIDLQANGGGTILLGYDLYKILFPNDVGHAAADHFRAFESTDLLGQLFSAAAENVPRELVPQGQNDTLEQLEENVVSAVFNYQTDTDVDGNPFPNWPAKFGPASHEKGDNFTSLFRWNLGDVLTPLNSGGIYVHGYGPLSNYTEQPFAAEDIVVVTDGYCASTCTIFSELMRQRAGVKYISLGGRSRDGITQAVGGVKGTNDLGWADIQSYAQYAIQNLATPEEAAHLNTTQLGEYWSTVPADRSAVGIPFNVNFRDGIRDTDLYGATDVPLQFVYEASDCRILYTKKMTVDVTEIWKAVADTRWGRNSHCVAGGIASYGNNNYKREPRSEDAALSRRMHEWRRELEETDYPMDVRTDLRHVQLAGDGVMWP